jgi:opacity protein-like surface antigen
MKLRGPFRFAPVLLALAAPARAEVLVEVFAGKSFTRPSDLVLRQAGRGTDVAFRGVRFDDQSLRSPPYYGYRATYFPRERSALGAGLEFVHFKAIARTAASYRAQGTLNGRPVDGDARLADTVQSFEVSHGMNLLTFNLQARPPSRGAAWPYAGAGIGVSIPHAESEVEGQSGPNRYALGSHPAFQAFAGVRGSPWKDLIVFGEYKYSDARLNAPVAGGTASVRFATHHAIIGTGVRFRAGGDQPSR